MIGTDYGETISPTPQQELELAVRALDEGKPASAARHLSGVLGRHPLQRGIEGVMARWLASIDDAASLVPIRNGRGSRGDVALRAFALHHRGRTLEASTLLLYVQAAAPELPFAARIAEWLGCAQGTDSDLAELAPALGECVTHPHLALALMPALRHLVEHALPNGSVAFAAVRGARNAGKLLECVALADRAYVRSPSWLTASARAVARRARGDFSGAIACYRDALRYNPTDASAWLDIGDLCIDERPEEAKAAYQAVLAREPHHPWAEASDWYLRWRDQGDVVARTAILRRAAQEGHDSHAAVLARRVDVYEYALVRPNCDDAALGADTGESIPDAARTAPTAVAAAVVALASDAYSLTNWANRARDVGATLGAAAAPELTLLANRPPAAPIGFERPDWVFRAQVAAALTLSGLCTSWTGSERKRALLSLWRGPTGWTTTAALIALTEIVRLEPKLARDIVPMLLEQLTPSDDRVRRSCITEPMLVLLDRAPLSAAVRKRLAAARREFSCAST